MPYENLHVGQKVTVNGKPGSIRSNEGPYKVVFDDGSAGFYNGNEITPIVVPSSLKGASKYDRLKAEGKLDDGRMMEPEAQGEDPFSPPQEEKVKKGKDTVAAKKATEDKFKGSRA